MGVRWWLVAPVWWIAAGSAAEPAGSRDPFADVVLVGSDDGFWCSGVLVDGLHVLTAAHCASATKIGVGARAQDAITVRVAARRIHPVEDVAVLVLVQPSFVEVHASRGRADDAPPLGALKIIGFGVQDPLRPSTFGAKHELDIHVDGWGCTLARKAATGCRPGSELFIRGGRGNDTCLGDSGGPVFEAVDDGWRLLAITSRGTRPRRVICGEGGIYVRVDVIRDWLSEAL